MIILAELPAKMLARLPVAILATSKNFGHIISEKNCRWTIEYDVRVSGKQLKLFLNEHFCQATERCN